MRDCEKEPPKIIYVPSFANLNSEVSNEIDLREVCGCLWHRKGFIAGFTAACTLAAIIVACLVLPVTYKSEAVLVPAQSPEDAASQLAGLAKFLVLLSTSPDAVPLPPPIEAWRTACAKA